MYVRFLETPGPYRRKTPGAGPSRLSRGIADFPDRHMILEGDTVLVHIL